MSAKKDDGSREWTLNLNEGAYDSPLTHVCVWNDPSHYPTICAVRHATSILCTITARMKSLMNAARSVATIFRLVKKAFG